MFRFKMTLLGVLAAFALGAVASASASADSCNGGLHLVFCTFPGNQPVHNLAIAGTTGLFVFASKIGAVEVKTHCTDSVIVGTAHLLGLLEGEIDHLDCVSEKPANCTINSLILAFFHLQMESTTKGLLTGNKAGGAAQEFTSVTLSGTSCAIAGTYTVTGTQELEFPEGGTGKVNHEIVAKKAGSKLKLGTEAASMSFTGTVHSHSNEEWLIMAGE